MLLVRVVLVATTECSVYKLGLQGVYWHPATLVRCQQCRPLLKGAGSRVRVADRHPSGQEGAARPLKLTDEWLWFPTSRTATCRTVYF
jgi:hypothetical protein